MKTLRMLVAAPVIAVAALSSAATAAQAAPAVYVQPAPAPVPLAPSALFGIQVCKVNTPTIAATVTQITGRATVSCFGSSSSKLQTECRMQRLYGGMGVYRWIDAYGYNYTRTSHAQSCSWTMPRNPGRYRVIARHVVYGPSAVKSSGWNQSRALDVTSW